MKRYHCTAKEFLPAILSAGSTQGDVATSPTGGFQAPWLTADPEPANQDWKRGAGVNKSAVRLTVDLPDHDPNLRHWPALARERRARWKWDKA
jgi:hypothetical protein